MSTVSEFQTEAPKLARLRVELPHWAADIRLFDDLSRPVTRIPGLRAEPSGRYVTDIDAPAGIYDLEVSFLGKTFRDVIALAVARPFTWTPPNWSDLAAPAALTATREPIDRIIREKKRTWVDSKGDSELLLSIRMVDEQGQPLAIRPMRFVGFDAQDNETLVTDFSNTSERPADGAIAFSAELPSGQYVMKSEHPDGGYWCRPVYLVPGWSTHLAISVDRTPEGQRLVAVRMSEIGRDSVVDPAAEVASLAVLDALTRGAETQFITREHIDALTHREDADPWLAVLAAYALLPTVESEPFRGRLTDQDTAGLFAELQAFLSTKLPQHPDVRALTLNLDEPSPPFPYPPLLLAGLRRVRTHSARWRGTIPKGSLTDRLLDEVAPGAPWTTWIDGRDVSPVTQDDRVIVRPAFLQSVGSKAPVFRIRSSRNRNEPGAAPPDNRPVGAREALQEAQIVDLVNQSVYGAGVQQSLPDLNIDTSAEFSKLLSLDPNVIGQATNIPVDRVESALESIRAVTSTSPADPKEPSPLSSIEQRLVAFAIGDKAFAPRTPGLAPSVTVEEVLLKLKGVADQLADISPEQAQDRGSVHVILDSVNRVVAALLQRCALIALTDLDGNIVYGNGAFLAFLDLGAPDGALSPARPQSCVTQDRWEAALRSQPQGDSVLTNVGGASDATRWTLRRASVKDARGPSAIAFVNVLTAEGASPIGEATLARISLLVHRVALGTSVYTYGSARGGKAHSENAVDMLEEIEQLIASGTASDIAAQSDPPSADSASGVAPTAADTSLDVGAAMFRSASKTTPATIMMGRTRIGPINTDATVGEINGRAIFEGDIDLGPVDELRMSARGIAIGRGIGINGAQFRWPTPTIPFESVAALSARVKAATEHWSQKTPFKFVERTDEEDFLSFQVRDGCFSMVGRQGGRQVISLGSGCGLGAAIHEIGHALGLWHEQSRADRDDHVTIVEANIDPAQRHNFDKHVLDGTDLGSYDFASIMHYPSTAFSINGQDTIRTKNGESIGQRNGLSNGDVAAIKLLYPQSALFDWQPFGV